MYCKRVFCVYLNDCAVQRVPGQIHFILFLKKFLVWGMSGKKVSFRIGNVSKIVINFDDNLFDNARSFV